MICLGRELDANHGMNEDMAEINGSLKQELYALQNHADLLALQNADLQKELDEFVLTDDIIRNGLDRKGRVSQIKQRVEKTILHSRHQLEQSRSRSPQMRQRSISPYNQPISQFPTLANQTQGSGYNNNFIRCDDRQNPQRSNFKVSPSYGQNQFYNDQGSQVKQYMQNQSRGNHSARGMSDTSYADQNQSYYGNDSPLRQTSPPRK